MKTIASILLSAMLAALLPLRAAALSSDSFVIAIDALSVGGGTVESTNYVVSSLAGQPLAVGEVSSAGVTMHGGYYYIRLLEELLRKQVTCLAVNSAAVYAGFNGEGIRKSTDGGVTWILPAVPPGNPHIRGLVIHPAVRTTLFAATRGGGVYRSTDGGDTWSVSAAGLTNLNCVTLAINAAGRLYAGTEEGIFTSADGAAWTALSNGLTVDARTPPAAILIDPDRPATLYAGLDGAGIFRSTNGGASWSAASVQPAHLRIKALAVDPTDTSTLFAASHGGGVFMSSDGGNTWSACGNAGLSDLNLTSLLADAEGKLYAGTGSGVFVSTDAGGTWTAMNAGLPE